MHIHLARHLSMEISSFVYRSFYYKNKNLAIEIACSGKLSEHSLSQIGEAQAPEPCQVYISVQVLLVEKAASLIQSITAVSGALYAPETYRIFFDQLPRKVGRR